MLDDFRIHQNNLIIGAGTARRDACISEEKAAHPAFWE
jgi:hypothetical protein